MRIDVITLFPEMIVQGLQHGLIGQAIRRHILTVESHNPRAHTMDVHHTVDGRPFGGGDGMLMLYEPLAASLTEIRKNNSGPCLLLSPQGQRLDHKVVARLSEHQALVLVCGRYAGVDQRFVNDWVDEEISIGDYVLCGGELPAMVLVEAIGRQLPAVLGNKTSAQKDSFVEGVLEAPQFTRPATLGQAKVPALLTSGNHAAIDNWRRSLSVLVTLYKRPDLCAHLSPAIKREAYRTWTAMTAAERAACGFASHWQIDPAWESC